MERTFVPAKRVKNAHRKSSKRQSLKAFAREHAADDSKLGDACRKWLATKEVKT